MLKISYNIEEDASYSRDSDLNITGGISIQYNDVILTKNAYNDFFGYDLCNEILNILYNFDALQRGSPLEVDIEESLIAFRFIQIGDYVYFKIVDTTTDKDVSNEIEGMSPTKGENGYPLPAKEFYNEFLKMSKQFIADVWKRYSISYDQISGFLRALDIAERRVVEYNQEH